LSGFWNKFGKYLLNPITQTDIDAPFDMVRFCLCKKRVRWSWKDPELRTENNFGIRISVRIYPTHRRPNDIIGFVCEIGIICVNIGHMKELAGSLNKLYIPRMACP
jgi:hypothetical protein